MKKHLPAIIAWIIIILLVLPLFLNDSMSGWLLGKEQLLTGIVMIVIFIIPAAYFANGIFKKTISFESLSQSIFVMALFFPAYLVDYLKFHIYIGFDTSWVIMTEVLLIYIVRKTSNRLKKER